MGETRYYGIYTEYDNKQDCWWIFDGNGGEQDFDNQPTEQDIEDYRNRVTENGTIFYR